MKFSFYGFMPFKVATQMPSPHGVKNVTSPNGSHKIAPTVDFFPTKFSKNVYIDSLYL